MGIVLWCSGVLLFLIELSLDAAGAGAERAGMANFFWFHHLAGVASVLAIGAFVSARRRYQGWAAKVLLVLIVLLGADLIFRIVGILRNLP